MAWQVDQVAAARAITNSTKRMRRSTEVNILVSTQKSGRNVKRGRNGELLNWGLRSSHRIEVRRSQRNSRPRSSCRLHTHTPIRSRLYDFLGSAAAVLVTRLKSLHCGFGFDPSFIDCIGCERDIWRTGLRHPVNDAALLLQRIQYHVKGGFPFRGL
jgi:hypothetical protein